MDIYHCSSLPFALFPLSVLSSGRAPASSGSLNHALLGKYVASFVVIPCKA